MRYLMRFIDDALDLVAALAGHLHLCRDRQSPRHLSIRGFQTLTPRPSLCVSASLMGFFLCAYTKVFIICLCPMMPGYIVLSEHGIQSAEFLVSGFEFRDSSPRLQDSHSSRGRAFHWLAYL
jgi:hypothetical protein